MVIGIGHGTSGYASVPQNDGVPPGGRNTVELASAPTLDGLMQAFAAANGDQNAPLLAAEDRQGVHIVVPRSAVPSIWTRFKAALSNLPLFNRSAAVRAARLEVARPLDEHASAGADLRTGILTAIRREVGEGREAYAAHVLSAKSLTKRTVERVLQVAVDERDQVRGIARAREARNRHAAVMREAADRGGDWQLRRVSEAMANTHVVQSAQDAPSTVPEKAQQGRPAAQLPVFEAELSRYRQDRDRKLFDHCAGLVGRRLGTSDATAVAEAAKDLHDRVQDFLAQRDRWPIADAEEFEDEIKALAAAMDTLNT